MEEKGYNYISSSEILSTRSKCWMKIDHFKAILWHFSLPGDVEFVCRNHITWLFSIFWWRCPFTWAAVNEKLFNRLLHTTNSVHLTIPSSIFHIQTFQEQRPVPDLLQFRWKLLPWTTDEPVASTESRWGNSAPDAGIGIWKVVKIMDLAVGVSAFDWRCISYYPEGVSLSVLDWEESGSTFRTS